MKFIFAFLFLFQIQSIYAQDSSDKDALIETFHLFKDGALLQFKEKNNLYYLGAALPSTYYSFEHDERLSQNQRAKKLRKIYDITGDLGVLFNFPVVPISLYYLGKGKDEKLVQFAKEYMAAMYLTLIETGVISYIPSHERPNKVDQSFWETSFRGKNSFPSGHIVPYSVLFFKTMQFYGPTAAVVPGVLTYFASMQRIREGRHYVSDIIGAFWLSAFASEGVRSASKTDKNSSFYKKYFTKIDLSVFTYQNVISPQIILQF